MSGLVQLFPALQPWHETSALQRWQTTVLGGVPAMFGLFLRALRAEGEGLWGPAAWCAAVGAAAFWAGWRWLEGRAKAGGARRGWLGLAHYGVRAAFLVLTAWMAWAAFGETAEGGSWPFALLGALVALHPAERVAREAARAYAPRFVALRGVFLVAEIWAGIGGVLGLVTGAILEAHKNYPTDPTLLLLALWTVGVLAGAGALFAVWVQAANRGAGGGGWTAQALDDPAEEGEAGRGKAPSDEY